MKLRLLPGFTLFFCCALLSASAQPHVVSAIPHLEKRGTATQLIVDGKLFLVLGGELHNSSSSNIEYVDPILANGLILSQSVKNIACSSHVTTHFGYEQRIP